MSREVLALFEALPRAEGPVDRTKLPRVVEIETKGGTVRAYSLVASSASPAHVYFVGAIADDHEDPFRVWLAREAKPGAWLIVRSEDAAAGRDPSTCAFAVQRFHGVELRPMSKGGAA